MKAIFAATLLSIALCSCAAHNNAKISHNLVGPTVVGDGSSVLVSHVRTQADGRQLAEKHCKRFGKSAQSIGWKDYEHISITNLAHRL
jgi:predicted naringenin-chalcone synthase